MLFGELVAISDDVRATSARRDKVDLLAATLRAEASTDVATVVELLLRTDLMQPVGAPPSSPTPARAVASLTCEAVVAALSDIDRAPAEPLRRTRLDDLMLRATAAEQRWLLEVTDHAQLDRATFDLVLSAAARAARVQVGVLRRAATLAGSLPLAVRIACERGAGGAAAITFEPGRPIPPTLIDGIEQPDALVGLAETSIVEWNIGSERIQVHRCRGEVTVYDERLTDVTSRAAVVVDQVAGLPRGDLVLDGWATLGGGSAGNAPAVDSWTKHSPTTRAALEAIFFDVMFEGVSLVDDPLAHRRGVLESIVPSNWLVPALDVGTLDAVADALNEGMRRGYPGLIVKPSASPYEGGLVRSSWRSIEPAHLLRFGVVGAERGSGRRADLLSAVLLAAHDDDGALTLVARTARGLNDEIVERQTELFEHLVVGESTSDRTVHLRPELVAVTSFDAVASSERFDSGLSLINPRIIGYQRSSDGDVATLTELQALTSIDANVVDDDSADDQLVLPTLPSLPAHGVAPAPTDHGAPPGQPADGGSVSLALGATSSPASEPVVSVSGVRFEPYSEPELLSLRREATAVIMTRSIALAWVISLLVLAVIGRNSSDGPDMSLVNRFGLGVALVGAAIAVSGWWWTDRLVRTLRLLDGRRPNRIRAVTAWLTPAVIVALLALAIVPLEPTEPADIRPVLLTVGFAVVVWRPYALIRRILTTLTRARSDVLLASGYLIDALGFGVVWWRLTDVSPDDATTGDVDVLIGVLGAVAVAMAAGLVVWMGLVTATREAVEYRRMSQRTRYEHRMLRLGGLDPTDPDVWWALVQRRADEERAAAPPDAPPATHVLTVDEMIEITRREHSVAFRQLDADEAEALIDRLRAEYASILDEPPGPPGAEAPESAPDRSVDDGDLVAALRSADDPGRTDSGFEGLIGRAGTLEVEAALAAHRQSADERTPGVRFGPPRLIAIELARLLTAATLAAVTVAALWLVVLAMGSDVAGALTDIGDIDLARRVFWGLFTSGGALLSIWAVAVLTTAQRAGMRGLALAQTRGFAVVATGACVAGFVADGSRGNITLLLSVVIVWCAVSAAVAVEQVRRWLALSAAALTTWIFTLPLVLFVAWLGGLASSIDPSQSLRRLAFATILLALGCARAAVVSVLSSLEVEDGLRVAPELAVPVHSTKRRTTSV